MSTNLKLKRVNKSFVPEPKKRVVSVSCFSDSYVYEHLWTFSVSVWICLFHEFVSWSYIFEIIYYNTTTIKIYHNSIIVTFVVTSNVPHELAKPAISFWIEKHPKTLHARVNQNIIIDGITLIVNDYSFQFDKWYFLQSLGTVIENKITATYGTPTSAYLDQNLCDHNETTQTI